VFPVFFEINIFRRISDSKLIYFLQSVLPTLPFSSHTFRGNMWF